MNGSQRLLFGRRGRFRAVGRLRGRSTSDWHMEGECRLLQSDILVLQRAQELAEVVILAHLTLILLLQLGDVVFELLISANQY